MEQKIETESFETCSLCNESYELDLETGLCSRCKGSSFVSKEDRLPRLFFCVWSVVAFVSFLVFSFCAWSFVLIGVSSVLETVKPISLFVFVVSFVLSGIHGGILIVSKVIRYLKK